jgi:aminoglycoside/choline kinase family phosphotransferase
MLNGKTVYFIDFQGGRIGPLQYDLASLLIDPYVELPHRIQNRLLDYSIKMLSATTAVDPDKFRICYSYCALTRNLQILGAFAYLSKVTGKKQFEQYIPAALQSLSLNLLTYGQDKFPALTVAVQKARGQLEKTGIPSPEIKGTS